MFFKVAAFNHHHYHHLHHHYYHSYHYPAQLKGEFEEKEYFFYQLP